jgi:hypothetical protein
MRGAARSLRGPPAKAGLAMVAILAQRVVPPLRLLTLNINNQWFEVLTA